MNTKYNRSRIFTFGNVSRHTSLIIRILNISSISFSGDGASGFKSESEANLTRDCLANFLYARIFSWLVCSINKFLNIGGDTKRLFAIIYKMVYSVEKEEIKLIFLFESFCIFVGFKSYFMKDFFFLMLYQ